MTSTPAPTPDLITERLVLRPWTVSDADAVLADDRATDWAGDFPAEGDRVIAGLFAEHPDWLGPYGHRLIVERASHSVVGSIGLFRPPADGALELGYGIVPSCRGRGYATEATRAMAAFALTAPDVDAVVARAELSNPSSVRVLEKAGFHHFATAENTAGFRTHPPDVTRLGEPPAAP
ncbi:GNAT family N-acetyltransferase [Streptomyces sp. NPDC050264]|uniref:GNAT family N-acetyltransferase n=1 Tax=Streptomyces sp. NPDC050264 TaxID=3155038 RepID=UPI0034461652